MGMASDRVVPVRILASVKQQRHYGDMPMLRSQRLRGPEGIGPERYSGATRGLTDACSPVLGGRQGARCPDRRHSIRVARRSWPPW